MTDTEPIKLNLGAGPIAYEGYTPIDRLNGTEAYPLDYADGTVAEIYASHILEHFDYAQIEAVMADWVRALEPGGRIRIGVPDFAWIAEHYLDGDPIPSQTYTMGEQVDDNDYHKVLFDRETLTELFCNSGLERIGMFAPPIDDCTKLPVSLNLQGFKPSGDAKKCEGVMACLSAPRYGPVLHMRCAFDALAGARVPYMICQGVYWCQVLTQVMGELLERKAEYILTVDYDTVFIRDDVIELYRLMQAHEDIDAICAMQIKRTGDGPLFLMLDANGKMRGEFNTAEFARNVTPIDSGHFGLTMFRASALRKLPHPWFLGVPDPDGKWGKGKVDPDMSFWRHWKDAGLQLGLASRVVIGHLEEMISWPTQEFRPTYQRPQDWDKDGIPPEVQR